MFKNGVTFVKNAKCLGLPSVAKADKNVGQVYELVIRNSIITVYDVQHIRVLQYLGQFRTSERQYECESDHHDCGLHLSTLLCMCIHFWLRVKCHSTATTGT